MASGFMAQGSAYLVRLIVIRTLSLEGAGYYQSAWVLGGLYVGFILQAMGADFYPRLTAVANQHPECNRLVNEQIEVGFLMAGPGILGTLTFAPLIVTLLYRGDFGPAVEILRWLCLGMMLRVVIWPMGFIIIAKGERKLFFWTELLVNAGYVGLVWLGVRAFGLRGTGIAFLGMYLVHFVVVYLIVSRLSGFRWTAPNRQLALIFGPLVAVVFAGWYLLPPAAAVGLGALVTLPAGYYSLKSLCAMIPMERLPRVVRKLAGLLRLHPANNLC
jgi:PST family polysaccharide transporter